jgi:hypothetical protein
MPLLSESRSFISITISANESRFSAYCRALLRRNFAGPGDFASTGSEAADYFVLKPEYSGFYATTLDVPLECLRVDRLIEPKPEK